jgi:hypothetical protein
MSQDETYQSLERAEKLFMRRFYLAVAAFCVLLTLVACSSNFPDISVDVTRKNASPPPPAVVIQNPVQPGPGGS